MKGVIVSAVILTFLCGLFIFNGYSVQKCSKTVSDEMNTMQKLIENDDYKTADLQCKKVSKMWDTQMKKMLYICHHDQIEAIDKAVFSANVYISNKEYDNAAFSISMAQFLVRDLKRHEKITLDNIF